MKQRILTFVALCASLTLNAQSAYDDIQKNIHKSASSQLAYPGPRQVQLTPAPEDKKPFYISHYGRHGSRFLIGKKTYDIPYFALAKADSLGKLTPLGQDVLKRVTLMRREAENRLGELTPLGVKQHQQIAKRMYERFPEVFAGRTCIDAKSTTVVRCILSMESALLQFLIKNPNLMIRHDASQHDMYYMNQHDSKLKEQRMDSTITAIYKDFSKKYAIGHKLMPKLFNDPDYVNDSVKVETLASALFNMASNVQNTELRTKITLYDLFSDEELYNYWKVDNAWWYINYGGYTLNGSKQPYSQRNLLWKIIQEADSCMQLEHPGATLRFGHDTMVMPLTCLLELDGFGLQTDNLESLERKGWMNYKIFPMAANIQFVFYRKDLQDQDVLVKVLLNENEVTLPMKSSEAPYYKWSDVRDYYLKKLDAYQE